MPVAVLWVRHLFLLLSFSLFLCFYVLLFVFVPLFVCFGSCVCSFVFVSLFVPLFWFLCLFLCSFVCLFLCLFPLLTSFLYTLCICLYSLLSLFPFLNLFFQSFLILSLSFSRCQSVEIQKDFLDAQRIIKRYEGLLSELKAKLEESDINSRAYPEKVGNEIVSVK